MKTGAESSTTGPAGQIAHAARLTPKRRLEYPPRMPATPEFHVFSKMFQPPVTASPEALCDLMAAAGFDGVQWTVRPGGHVEPERVEEDLPRLVRVAETRGLKCRSVCTAIVDGADPVSERIVGTASDCGIGLFRTGYFFYEPGRETYARSVDRIKRAFASLCDLGGRTGTRAAYQNHSFWGPPVFGGAVWDVLDVIRDLDPRHVSFEYDPMHAVLETFESWRYGMRRAAPWISSIDLKDFRYALSGDEPGRLDKAMVGAGEGVVPWREVREIVEECAIDPFYILHFERDFDRADLASTVRTELGAFRRFLS